MAKWKMRLTMKNQESRSTEWRHLLKDKHPKEYEALKKKDRRRKQMKRAEKKKTLTHTRAERMKMRHERELHRDAQSRYRARMKARKEPPCTPATVSSPTTPTAITSPTAPESRRAYNTNYRRKYRAQQTRQKQLAVRQKDRERKTPTGARKKKHSVGKQGPVATSITQSAAKVSKQLPKSPRSFERVMKKVANNLTPRKRSSLSKITKTKKDLFNKASASCLLGVIEELKRSTCNAARPARLLTMITCARVMKKYRLGLMASSILGVRYKTLLSPSTAHHRPLSNEVLERKSRRSERSQNHDAEVISFYMASEHTRELPLKKKVTKVNGSDNLQAGFVLDIPLRRLYEEYTEKYPDYHVGFTKFTKLRPSNVRLQRQADLVTCECVYCVNMDHKINAVRQIASKECDLVAHKYELVDKVLCKKSPVSAFHRSSCLNGSCEKCRDFDPTIRKLFQEVTEELQEKVLTWHEWVRKPVTFKTKDGESKTTVRRVLESKFGTIDELVDGLVKDFNSTAQGSFPFHLFIARWQYLQVRELKEHLPPNSILTILDFAQNWSVHFQNEIKSACYSKEQVTLHPIVVYYNDPVLNTLVRESLIFLSNDLNHDFYAVQAFVKRMYDYLRTERKLVIEREFRYTDGCSAQYKSIGPFVVLHNSLNELKSTVMQNYFGSEHGKYESDGENAITKSAVDRAILSGKVVIRNAEEMFAYCEQNLSVDEGVSRRVYMLENHIEHTGYDHGSYRTVKGTRKIHSIYASGNEMKTRPLSCMCPPCLSASPARCENTSYVAQWETIKLKKRQVPVNERRLRVSEDAIPVPGPSQVSCQDHNSQKMPEGSAESQFEVGKYVAVKAGHSKWYAGQLLTVDQENCEAEVNFMRMMPGSRLDEGSYVDFQWPSNKDVSWTGLDLMFTIPYPDITPRGERSIYRWGLSTITGIDSQIRML